MGPFLILLILAACGGEKKSPVEYGTTTVAALVALKGEPVKEETIPLKDSKVLIFEGNEKYQVEGDVVTNGFRDPRGDEKLLLYWKHRFKNCETTSTVVPRPKKIHTAKEVEFNCPTSGESVIYTEGSGHVERVRGHAKK